MQLERLKDPVNQPVQNAAGGLKAWLTVIGVVAVVGIGFYVSKINNPSDLDLYTGTNDDANKIIFFTSLVLTLLAIGAGFSYKKYSRIDQANLIAESIKSKDTDKDLPSSQVSLPLDQLERLIKIRDSGGITESEFEAMKKSIIKSASE